MVNHLLKLSSGLASLARFGYAFCFVHGPRPGKNQCNQLLAGAVRPCRDCLLGGLPCPNRVAGLRITERSVRKPRSFCDASSFTFYPTAWSAFVISDCSPTAGAVTPLHTAAYCSAQRVQVGTANMHSSYAAHCVPVRCTSSNGSPATNSIFDRARCGEI